VSTESAADQLSDYVRGRRWEWFSDGELAVIWDELRSDDGISYAIMEEESPVEYALACGIRDEAKRRSLDLRDLDITLIPLGEY
jgi:hypothetical protein